MRMSVKGVCPAQVVAVAAVGLGSTVSAQWVAIPLKPAGSSTSQALAADGAVQGGLATISAVQRAALWSGNAGSYVSLHPAGATVSAINAMGQGVQGGSARIGGHLHAGIWDGTAASWQDLHASGTDSEILSVWNGQQGGYALFLNRRHASIWSGSAASWTDLHPAGMQASEIAALQGDTQVGTVTLPNYPQAAALWHGTPESMVILSETDLLGSLGAGTCVDGDQQGGWYNYRGGAPHAYVWQGTKDSAVDLNTPGQTGSQVLGIGRGVQVGWSYTQLYSHAYLWRSTPGSAVDLHATLPNALASIARGISFTSDATYVVGEYVDLQTRHTDAVLWVGPASPCFLTRGPEDTVLCPHGEARLTARTLGSSGPFTYQWLRNGAPISAEDNPTAATAELTVSGADGTSSYSCIVTSPCGSVTTREAVARLCPADFNCDSFLDFFDYDGFVAAFEAGSPEADYNGDAFLDFFDYDGFVGDFETGC